MKTLKDKKPTVKKFDTTMGVIYLDLPDEIYFRLTKEQIRTFSWLCSTGFDFKDSNPLRPLRVTATYYGDHDKDLYLIICREDLNLSNENFNEFSRLWVITERGIGGNSGYVSQEALARGL